MEKEKFKEIINERPELMSYKDYKHELRLQNMKIKDYLENGTIVHKGGTFYGSVKLIKLEENN